MIISFSRRSRGIYDKLCDNFEEEILSHVYHYTSFGSARRTPNLCNLRLKISVDRQ